MFIVRLAICFPNQICWIRKPGGTARSGKWRPCSALPELTSRIALTGKILNEAGIFPASPLLSESDWLAICSYYEQSAPERPLPQGPRPKIQIGLKQFQVKELKYRSPMPMTTLVKIDPAKKRLYVGDAQSKNSKCSECQLGISWRALVWTSAPVSLTAKPEGLYVTLIGHVFPSDEKDGQLILLGEKKVIKIQGASNIEQPSAAHEHNFRRPEWRWPGRFCSFSFWQLSGPLLLVRESWWRQVSGTNPCSRDRVPSALMFTMPTKTVCRTFCADGAGQRRHLSFHKSRSRDL